MELKAGTLCDFSGSMAEDIQNAFLAAWGDAMPGQSAPKPTDQMRLLFVAVAQGVVKHLSVNAAAIVVNYFDGNGTATADTSIDTDSNLY